MLDHAFVVTGMPRSGTAYTAALLARLGFDCGHEQVFHPDLTEFTTMGHWDGDASWLAVPFLDQLPAGTRLVHQVRHPLLVAGSLVGTRFLEPAGWFETRRDDTWAYLKWRGRRALAERQYVAPGTVTPRPTSAFQAFLRRHLPAVWAEPAPLLQALRFWVDWNRLVLEAAPRFKARRVHRLEDVSSESVVDLVSFLGLGTTPQHARFVLGKVPSDLNRRTHTPVTWSDVPQGPLRVAVEEICANFGYDPSAPLGRGAATTGG